MSDDHDNLYTHLLLLDLDRRPNYPYVQCVSIENSGIRSVHKGRLKLSRNFRLRAIDLPTYGAERHMYHIVAKCHKDCSTNDRNRACTALNDFVTNALKTHMTIDGVMASIVEIFPSRVLQNKDFQNHNAPLTKYGSSSARFKGLAAISSSETDAMLTTKDDEEEFQSLKKAFPAKKG